MKGDCGQLQTEQGMRFRVVGVGHRLYSRPRFIDTVCGSWITRVADRQYTLVP